MGNTTKSKLTFLREQIGDSFEEVKPYLSLWHGDERTIFIRPKRNNTGFSKYLRAKHYIEQVDEAGGNNILRVIFK